MATYIGVGLYIVLYAGYTIYDMFIRKSEHHFVPILRVDLDSDAVWKKGEGKLVREQEHEEKVRRLEAEDAAARGVGRWWRHAREHFSWL